MRRVSHSVLLAASVCLCLAPAIASPLHGDLLVVDNFAVMDLFGPAGAAQTLIEAMEILAERHRCSAIHTLMPDHRPTPLHG